MKTLTIEILKIILLCVMVFVGLILSQTLGLFGDPATAKALKYKSVNQPNGILILTKKEKEEYMDYLRVLSGYTLEFTSEEKLPPIQIEATAGPTTTNYPWDNLDDVAQIAFVTT